MTRNGELATRIRRLTNFGFEAGVVDGPIGLNAKLSEWRSATALAVRDRFHDVLQRRRTIAGAMLKAISPHGFVQQSCPGSSAWQFVPVLVPPDRSRDTLISDGLRSGVELRHYFSVPLHRMPGFAELPVFGSLDVTDRLARTTLSLPMANDLREDAVDSIVATLTGR